MTCIQCGNEIPNTVKFCPFCGCSQCSAANQEHMQDMPGEQDTNPLSQEEIDVRTHENNNTPEEYYENIPTRLPQAVFTCLCCFPPVGIVALLFATKVSVFLQSNRYEEAKRASDCALKWIIAAVFCWVLTLMIGITLNILKFISF